MISKQLFADSSIHNLHFIGICGVAMASVAAELHRAGFQVTGSDPSPYPPMSTFLSEQGIQILKGFEAFNLPESGLIVVGNAVSRGNPELEAALNRRLQIISLPELVSRRYLAEKYSIVVTGTHGKTTTTNMTAHILAAAGKEPGWMVGGIPRDLPVPCQFGEGREFVIEGDEYDAVYYDKRPKFFHYRPYHAILNTVEFDHSDIYPDLAAIEQVFRRFVRLLPSQGNLVVNADDPLALSISADAMCRVIKIGTGKDCDWQYIEREFDHESGGFMRTPAGNQHHLSLSLFGKHNYINALSAIAVSVAAGVEVEDAIAAMSTFKGPARRLELVLNNENFTLYDDFAHHPSAISATLSALRQQYPNRRLWAIFEPRSNTMVKRYLMKELLDALKLADVVVLGSLHREQRIPLEQRLDREFIISELEKSDITSHAGINTEEIALYVKSKIRRGDLLVMMSNGSFGGLRNLLTVG